MIINAISNDVLRVYTPELVSKISKPEHQNTTPDKTANNNIIEDKAIISEEAFNLYKTEKNSKQENSSKKDEENLTPEEKRKLQDLKKRDKEVKDHEQAHLAAAGDLAVGSADYDYENGPDGNRYAVSGEVHLDTSKEKEPEETINKATKIKKAALAPAQPSEQDIKAANHADKMIQEAKAELQKEKPEDKKGLEQEKPELSNDAKTPKAV